MMKSFLLIVCGIIVLGLSHPCFADDAMDELLANQAMMGTIKTLGATAFAHKGTPEQIASDKSEVEKNYWAFISDAGVAAPLAKLEKDKFDQMWDELMRTTTAFDVTQVSFIGCDDVCLMKCLDLYYAAATTSGPMVIKFSLEFGVKGHARLFGIKTYTGWDEIKQVVRGIQHAPNSTRVPTITYTGPKGAKTEGRGDANTDP